MFKLNVRRQTWVEHCEKKLTYCSGVQTQNSLLNSHFCGKHTKLDLKNNLLPRKILLKNQFRSTEFNYGRCKESNIYTTQSFRPVRLGGLFVKTFT